MTDGGGGYLRTVTDSADSREPGDGVSRLLRLLERSGGEDGGDPVEEAGSPHRCCVFSKSKPRDEGLSL